MSFNNIRQLVYFHEWSGVMAFYAQVKILSLIEPFNLRIVEETGVFGKNH